MMVIAKSSRDDTIFLPEQLMALLQLHEGDEVKATIEGQVLRLAQVEAFLALRGVFADDDQFDDAMLVMHKGWDSWILPVSA